MTNQTYFALLGWVVLAAAITDGLAAVMFHVP
jgi:hypothetical protein